MEAVRETDRPAADAPCRAGRVLPLRDGRAQGTATAVARAGLGRAKAMIAVRENELLRHPAYTRVVHWSSAMFFVLALLSGFAIYSPWLFHWLTPLFGGGPMTRLLHPWFSLGFVLAYFFQFLNWLSLMRWTDADRRWLRHLPEYAKGESKLEPEYVGFYNG